MAGRGGSRKPILDIVPGSPDGVYDEMLLPTLDGRSLTAIAVLLEVSGDWEIACERTGLSEAEFARALAQCNPIEVANGIRAIHLMQISKMASAIGLAITEKLDEAKPGQLISLYPKLIELIPMLAEARVRVNDHRTNNLNLNFGADAIPPDVLDALSALGLRVEREKDASSLEQILEAGA